MATQMNTIELIEMLDSEYDNLQYLGTILSECDTYASYEEYDYILTAINNTKETISIYKNILQLRYSHPCSEEQNKKNLSILNDSLIIDIPFD